MDGGDEFRACRPAPEERALAQAAETNIADMDEDIPF